MKPLQLHARPLVQTDLFDRVAAPPALTSLELRHNELVELLSQLLWQVVHAEDTTQRLEESREQDRS